MTDQRFAALAHKLINYSVELKKGEKILIEVTDPESDFTKALISAAYAVGGLPFVKLENSAVQRQWLLGVNAEQVEAQARWDVARMSEMAAYVGVRVRQNAFELAGVPPEKLALFNKLLQEPVHQSLRVPKTKWVVLRYPNDSMAQEAKLSSDDFAEHYFKVCTLDYKKMSRAMDPLVALINRTDRVEISGAGTELNFSIKGIGAVKCDGKRNIPDGEVYTAPVRDSVEGCITYNTASVNQGTSYEQVRLEFCGGKIVKAVCGNQPAEKLEKIFDIDEGARYIGEFAFGLNPHIMEPINDILFDEKINGSFHFTPGCCYDSADNGNKSALHWDLVCVQRPDFGGGEIRFDGQLVRKDGLFVLPELLGLNPENLV